MSTKVVMTSGKFCLDCRNLENSWERSSVTGWPRLERRALCAIAAFAAAVTLGAAQAEPGRPADPALPIAGADQPVAAWELRSFDYAVIDQELRDLLSEFGRHVGLAVTVSDQVRGRVRGRLPPLPPRLFLERLAAVHGFDWYVDGTTLHVSAAAEARSLLLDLNQVAPAALEAALRQLGVLDARWPLRAANGGTNLALVSGPPRYVALVEQTLAALVRRPRQPDGSAQPQTAPVNIRIFRGRTEFRT